ncbi:MAG: hypothetical protein ABFD90_17575, partial [Phycisphaerales bacterium]
MADHPSSIIDLFGVGARPATQYNRILVKAMMVRGRRWFAPIIGHQKSIITIEEENAMSHNCSHLSRRAFLGTAAAIAVPCIVPASVF